MYLKPFSAEPLAHAVFQIVTGELLLIVNFF